MKKSTSLKNIDESIDFYKQKIKNIPILSKDEEYNLAYQTQQGKLNVFTSGKKQMVSLLMSTYENAVEQNRVLVKTQAELSDLNEHLNDKIMERTTALSNEIVVRKEVERRQIITNKILSILNRENEWQQLIQDILKCIKEFTGFEAVGIRLKEGPDYPYFETNGFPADFLKTENFLCSRDKCNNIIMDNDGNPILECMCGNVIRKLTDSTKPFFTTDGSFWSNNTTELLAKTTDVDRQAHACNCCNSSGYESVALIPLKSGDETIGLLQFNDKRTDRFTAEIIQFFESIGSTIGIAYKKQQSTRDLIAAKEKAEEMSRLKSSFLANMSHELRTPMIGILGYSEILIEDSTDPGIKETASIINKSGHRLMDTLNLILDLSRVEAGKLEIKLDKVDIIKTAHEVCNVFEESANSKSLFLKIKSNCKSLELDLDEKLFHEIMNNLINNALKFTSRGGVFVEILSEISGTTEWAVINVIDTGVGIEEENLSLIWEEFRQVSEGLGRSFEGTGLGLTITKKLVDIMNGTISVDSQPNVGSVFTVRFPISRIQKDETLQITIEESPIITAPAEITSTELPHFLYVEDDLLAFTYVEKVLIKYCKIDRAINSEEAIIKAKETQYDGILMDINLGRGADGLETTKIIRQLNSYKDLPIIAITAFAMQGDKEEFIQAGCSDYISKPFNRSELINLITSVLKKTNHPFISIKAKKSE